MRCLFEIDHNLTVPKLKCIRSKHANYEKIKIATISRLYKAMHHNGSYLLSRAKINFKNFDIS